MDVRPPLRPWHGERRLRDRRGARPRRAVFASAGPRLGAPPGPLSHAAGAVRSGPSDAADRQDPPPPEPPGAGVRRRLGPPARTPSASSRRSSRRASPGACWPSSAWRCCWKKVRGAPPLRRSPGTEADHVQKLVAGAYGTMRDFDRFAACSLLYFAAASFAEASQRLLPGPADGWAWNGFLGSTDPVTREMLAPRPRCTPRTGLRGGDPESHRAAQPGGLADPARNRLYRWTWSLWWRTRGYLGLTREEIRAGDSAGCGGGEGYGSRGAFGSSPFLPPRRPSLPPVRGPGFRWPGPRPGHPGPGFRAENKVFRRSADEEPLLAHQWAVSADLWAGWSPCWAGGSPSGHSRDLGKGPASRSRGRRPIDGPVPALSRDLRDLGKGRNGPHRGRSSPRWALPAQLHGRSDRPHRWPAAAIPVYPEPAPAPPGYPPPASGPQHRRRRFPHLEESRRVPSPRARRSLPALGPGPSELSASRSACSQSVEATGAGGGIDLHRHPPLDGLRGDQQLDRQDRLRRSAAPCAACGRRWWPWRRGPRRWRRWGWSRRVAGWVRTLFSETMPAAQYWMIISPS